MKQNLLEELLENNYGIVEEAYEKYKRTKLAEARASLSPEDVLHEVIRNDPPEKVREWLLVFFEAVLDHWNKLSNEESCYLDNYGMPTDPSHLIPDRRSITEPGFIKTAMILDAISSETIYNSHIVTHNVPPHVVLKRALYKEMVKLASVVIKSVEDFLYRGT